MKLKNVLMISLAGTYFNIGEEGKPGWDYSGSVDDLIRTLPYHKLERDVVLMYYNEGNLELDSSVMIHPGISVWIR